MKMTALKELQQLYTKLIATHANHDSRYEEGHEDGYRLGILRAINIIENSGHPDSEET